MVKNQKSGSWKWEIGNRILLGLILSLLPTSYFLLPCALLGQQPQTSDVTNVPPLYRVNSSYVNGVAPGYWSTAGAGLVLNLSAGTAFCGNPPLVVNYAGGTLTMTASATNYVYLNPAASCAPATSTTAFSIGQIPIATVVTGASAITTITDARTWFAPVACQMSSTGSIQCSALGTNQNITLTPSGGGYTILNGNIGVGTTIPNSLLSLGASGNSNYIIYAHRSTNVNVGFGQQSINGVLAPSIEGVNDAISTNVGLGLYGNPIILMSGNVGIGTTSPQINLDVAGPIRASAVTFATLPACSSTIEGALRGVTDSTIATWGSTIAGGGTNHVLAYCDGTSWTVAAK